VLSPRAIAVAIALVTSQAGCAARSAAVPASDLQHDFDVRSEALQRSESAKDVDLIMTYWAPDAVLHVDGAPAIQGAAAIRQAYVGMLPSIGAIRSERTGVSIARSGDVAYETGTNFITANTPTGPLPVTSKYVIVWTRHAPAPWLVQAISVTNNPR
jgi:ketosteroid isomerase-like protein